MAKELLIRKQKGTHSPQCTSYRIVEPAWRFTLETCDEDVTGVIKDDVGNTIATVSAGAPAIVSRLGLYNVCVTGNGMGALYVEWTSDTYVDQQCCNEVRKEFEQMLDDAIANVESKIPTSSVTVRGGENTEVTKSGNTYTVNATDTVTTLKAGNGIALQRNGYEYTVSSKVANIVAGENVSVREGTESDGSPRFEISAVDTVPDVDKAYVDSKIAAIVDKDTVTTIVAGNQNVTITDSGTGGNHAYIISTVDTKPDVTKAYVDQQVASVPRPDVTKAYVDEQIAALEDKDTKTTMVAGNQNVTITDSGVGGNHVYSVSTKDTVTTVKAGDNISVTKNGNEYTVTATGGGGTDTVTTLVAGTGISITDSGTGGNHQYTVTATGGGGSSIDIQGGNNIAVDKSGNIYYINVDPDETLEMRAGIDIKNNDGEVTISAVPSGSIYLYGTDRVGHSTSSTISSNYINVTGKNIDDNDLIVDIGNGTIKTSAPNVSEYVEISTYEIDLCNVVSISGRNGNGYIDGLTNKTWNDNNYTSGRAATEDQLNVLADRIAALEARL